MFKRIISIMLVLIVAFSCITSAFASVNFQDVMKDTYYYNAVQWAINNGITNGTSQTTFSPNRGCTRAQIVTFIWRMAGSPRPKYHTTDFKDIKQTDYFYDAVCWAYTADANSFVKGTAPGQFSPYKTCTRAEIVTFLWRFYHCTDYWTIIPADKTPFPDVDKNSWCAAAVEWAVRCKITSGTDAHHFSPQDTCTRAQAVTFLYRAAVEANFGTKPGYVNP